MTLGQHGGTNSSIPSSPVAWIRATAVRNTGDKQRDNSPASRCQMNGSGRWDFPLPDGTYSDASIRGRNRDVCNYLPTAAE